MKVAVIMTVFNRKEKTLRCLDSLLETWENAGQQIEPTVFLTDDGCTDGTADAIRERNYLFPVTILQGDGSLFWNGGMINSWKAAIEEGGWDGYLWLNDDVTILPEFWGDLLESDRFSLRTFGKRGIYVGSTRDSATGTFTYGGFNYTNKITLKDKMLPPDGTFQQCEAGHGNITFVSREVVEKMGIFCEEYIHGGTDHDYTWLAHKKGYPILVLPHYSAECENDHLGKTRDFTTWPLRERRKLFWSHRGYNMHNTLLFNRRCFPWRVPFVLLSGIAKLYVPKLGYGLYLRSRGVK